MPIKKLFWLFAFFAICSCSVNNQSAFLSNGSTLQPYQYPVDQYINLAEQSVEPSLQIDYQLKVAGRLIQDGMLTRARQQLKKIKPLTNIQRNEKYLLRAKLALLAKQPRTAMRLASKVEEASQMPVALQAYYHELLASAYQLSGKTLNEVAQLIRLDKLQKNTDQKVATRRAIWRALSTMPLAQEQALVTESQGELEGWLSLNVIAKVFRDDGLMLVEKVKAWQQLHPSHPANDIVIANPQTLGVSPQRIALMLPLSGGLSGPGNAIRDGFMSAYFEAKQKGASVKFYDSGQQSVDQLYQQAVKDGAQLIIGPLKKSNVARLAAIKGGLPVIALNDIDRRVPSQFYQLSIDPEHEAAQLADKVYDDGLRRALIIAPKGQWGESIGQTFEQQWRRRGGQVADLFLFEPKQDMNQAIRKLLDISDSYDRKNQLVKTIWKRPTFYPRRRQDFDVVIILAYASKARQIRPMLKYYFAGDVPVYGTSLLYSGSPNAHHDIDLNGVIFGEMPYLLKKPQQLVKKSWPEQLNSYNRLYAMGKDAYLLSHQLNQLKLFPLMGVFDNTGTLFIGSNGQIIRQLDWAKFEHGLAKPQV